MADFWMSPEELSEHFKVPLRTIYQWRTRQVGPKGYKIGRHVRYKVEDVVAWTEAQADEPRKVS